MRLKSVNIKIKAGKKVAPEMVNQNCDTFGQPRTFYQEGDF